MDMKRTTGAAARIITLGFLLYSAAGVAKEEAPSASSAAKLIYHPVPAVTDGQAQFIFTRYGR